MRLGLFARLATTLLALTKRHCVVLQTLRTPARVSAAIEATVARA
jgi:hypothetical protein